MRPGLVGRPTGGRSFVPMLLKPSSNEYLFTSRLRAPAVDAQSGRPPGGTPRQRAGPTTHPISRGTGTQRLRDVPRAARWSLGTHRPHDQRLRGVPRAARWRCRTHRTASRLAQHRPPTARHGRTAPAGEGCPTSEGTIYHYTQRSGLPFAFRSHA